MTCSGQKVDMSDGQLDCLLERLPGGVLAVAADGSVVALNRRACHMLGATEVGTVGTPLVSLFREDERGRLRELLSAKAKRREDAPSGLFHVGGAAEVELTATPFPRDGGERRWLVLLADANEAAELAAIRAAEAEQRARSRVLESLAKGAALDDVLSLLVETAEKLKPDMLCSVLLLDEDNKRLLHGAGPSLPDFYNEAINGLEIGPEVGSCARTVPRRSFRPRRSARRGTGT